MRHVSVRLSMKIQVEVQMTGHQVCLALEHCRLTKTFLHSVLWNPSLYLSAWARELMREIILGVKLV